jgi:Transposase, Mutator family
LQQFHRCYVCLSIAKHFWSHAGIGQISCDGTFTRNNCFKHIILIATTHDANNNITVLAFAIVEVENGDNWVWFKEQLEVDFAGITVWMSDADKGIKSNAFALSMSQSEDEFVLSRCARHLADNCRESCKGTMNETQKAAITTLAKSRTWDVYSRRLESIRSTNEEWAEYLDGRKEEFVAAAFLDKGIRRWGKVTSNSTETMNGVFGDARSLPIVYLMEHLVNYQRQKYHERFLQATKWSQQGMHTTQYCRDIQVQLADEASRRTVDLIESNHPLYRARVQSAFNAPINGYVEVEVDVNQRSSNCPCRFYLEEGISCAHVKALLLTLNRQSTWCSGRYAINTYLQCYSKAIPAMTVVGKLSVDETLAPPDFKRPAGRPAKKRRDRSHLKKTNVERECKACGLKGHYARGCTQPSTEYRYDKYKQSAVEWCRLNEPLLDE